MRWGLKKPNVIRCVAHVIQVKAVINTLSLFNDIQVPISCRQASVLVVVTDETESSEK